MELSYYYTKHLDYIGCFEGMRYLADFLGGEGAGTDRMPSRSDSGHLDLLFWM